MEMENEAKNRPVAKQVASPGLINQLFRKHSEVFDDPLRLLVIVVASVFLAETMIMLVLPAVRPLSTTTEALLDSLLLIIVIAPVLHFLVMKPARSYIVSRFRLEEAMRVSEEKYRSVVESTDDSVYLLDRNCRYLYMNKKHLARMGFSGDEYVGRAYSEFHPAEAAKEFTEAISKVFESCQPAQREHWSRRDDKYFLRTLSPVKGNDGRTVAVNVISKDITGLKQMEAEREKLIAGLREALAKINTLKGLIPICAWCKKVRDDKGYWNEIETYVKEHSEADFTHGICPECLKGLQDKEVRQTDGKDQ